MAMNINSNYSQFFRGTEQIKTYGASSGGKDTIVRYEFNTTDAQGNKVMDKMSREETLHAMKTISAQYGDNVIVEFSGDGMAALVESKKGVLDKIREQQDLDARQAAFDKEVVEVVKKMNHLPEYSGMFEVDKTIASVVENCSNEEQAFVYDIIRQNFLIRNSSSMTEEERQASISLGMKKAEYATGNFIPTEQKQAFLDAMESIAKLASAGKSDQNGNMDYGVKKGNYLGHGSNLVYTDDPLDIMRTMDAKAYAEYQEIHADSGNADSALNALKYMTNWYTKAVKTNPNMIDDYRKQSEEYIEENVKEQKLDETFSGIDVTDKKTFIESLKAFQMNHPDFLVIILNREMSMNFWK